MINDQEMIASPNTQLDSQVIANSSPFGGEVVTNRSKILMVTRWSGVIYVADIAFFRNSIDWNEVYPGSYYSSKNFFMNTT